MNYLSISDIHLGHRRTPTKHICANLLKYLLCEENKTLDVIFIAGDIYDRLLDASNEDYLLTLKIFGRLLSYCAAYNIKLRVLEGTPSHDWEQPRVLEYLNEINGNRVDLKYFDILAIEHIKEFDKHVLYIPDEWSKNHDDVEAQIAEQLKINGITTVDMAIMHGQFSYQMLDIPNPPFCYNEEYFLRTVTGFIHIGHFHKRSNYDRIHASGSFDRLAHNEEGPKGYDRVVNNELMFVENTNAYTYVSVKIKDDETFASLDKKLSKYPKGSHIRLNMKKNHPFNTNFREILKRYFNFVIDKKLTDVAEKKLATHILDGISFNNHTTGIGDIYNSVLNSIVNENELSDSQVDKLRNVLSPFKNSNIKEEVV